MLAVRVLCGYDLEQKITAMNDNRTYASIGIMMFENLPYGCREIILFDKCS
jgi:hypothetical protein